MMKRNTIFAAALAAVAALTMNAGLASEMPTKEQVIEKALKEHPGKVEKAYKETMKGQEVWEVKIKGDDGKEWEVYYDAKTGDLVKTKSE